MEILLCLLLYLTVITSPGTYSQSEIMDFEQANEQEISAIQQDQPLTAQIVETFIDDVQFVEVADYISE